MRKEATHGVTDEVMIGRKREGAGAGAGEEIGGTIPRRRGFTVTPPPVHIHSSSLGLMPDSIKVLL